MSAHPTRPRFAVRNFYCVLVPIALLCAATPVLAQEITISRLNLDSTAVRHLSGRPLSGGGGETRGIIPGGTTYDVHHAVGNVGGTFFLITDPSLPGEPDNIVHFDGIPEPLAADINGTIVIVNESDIAGAGTTHTITIDATAPPGRDIFPGNFSGGGFPLTDAGILIGVINNDRIDTDPGSIIDTASLEFFTNGISVAGPFDVSSILANPDGVWEGTMSISIGGIAGFGVDQWILSVQITENRFGCPPGNCPSDITPPGGNGTTNIDDLVTLLNDFGNTGPPRTIGDISSSCGNWVVNIDDLVQILSGFGLCPFVPGDLCPDAITVTTGSNSFISTGFTETLAPGINQCEFFDPQLDDIWFRFTASVSGIATADLCGSTFDGALSVFPNDCALTNAPFNALDCGDDNALACPGTAQPEVIWNVNAGESYILVASGWQGGGAGTLNLSEFAITNDICIGATSLVINGPFITNDNTAALTENPPALDCGPSLDGLSAGGAPLQTDGGRWFKFIGTGNILKATTCNSAQASLYSTFINIYCGGCPLQICVGDSNLDLCGFGPHAEIEWCSRLGEEYLILVHGMDLAGAPELFSLRVEDTLVPCTTAALCTLPGDTCATAQTMTIVPGSGPNGESQGTFTVDNTQMNSTIPVGVGCTGGIGVPPSNDFWITFTANQSGNARLDTCVTDFDTIINLWQFPVGGSCNLTNANIVACNDNASEGNSNTCGTGPPPPHPFSSALEVNLIAGTVYHVSVSEWGTGGHGGTAQFRVIENFASSGACDIGGVCTEGIAPTVCAAACGDFLPLGLCADIPTGACCVGGTCVGVMTRQGCGTNGSIARFTPGPTDCTGNNCADSCPNALASNGGFNGTNGVRPTAGFSVLGVIDDFTLDAPATLTSVNLGMIYNVGAGLGPVSGAVGYEITIYELGTPGIVGSACDPPTIADLVPSTAVPVAGPVVLTGVTLTLGAPAFGGHHEIVDGNFPAPINLTAGRYAMMVRVLDDPLNLFWGTANAAADGSADESAIFGTDGTVPPPVDTNAADGQRDHAFCIN